MNAEPCIELISVSKTFRDGGREVRALENIDLAARPGEFVTIIGPAPSSLMQSQSDSLTKRPALWMASSLLSW